jgi:hypothetical protein
VLFHRASQQQESRILTWVGLVTAVCLGVGTFLMWHSSARENLTSQLAVMIDAPYAGHGVDTGTALMMHGIKIGEVTSVTHVADGRVHLGTEIARDQAVGLTDTFHIDFRSANYFGITAINVIPGAGGSALADGSVISTVPLGNFTLQSFLSRVGAISNGVLDQHAIDVITKATQFTDSLDPFLETMLVVSETFARVQNVSTARLLNNATGISVALPAFVNGVITFGDHYVHAGLDNRSEVYFDKLFLPSINLIAFDLFGVIGKLEASHSTELAPVTDLVKQLTDIAPGLVPSDDIADTARELRVRLEKLFAGTPDRRAVDVRVVLDNLPAVAATVDAVEGAPR